ncbi:MAG: hypothetical protein JXR76_02200 [Deltaproteobacteria bacterium]|nr:hypothetical protein [Deltaproteobacteria bacterium]
MGRSEKMKMQLVASIVFIAGLASLVVSAGDNTTTRELRALYDRAIELDAVGKYGEAAATFRELIARSGQSNYYFNVALCDLSRDRFDLAYESFQIYLNASGDTIQSTYVNKAKELVVETAARIGFLEVAESVDSAKVCDETVMLLIDDEQRDLLALQGQIAVLPGEHTVKFVDSNDTVLETVVTINQGETTPIQCPDPEAVAEKTVTTPKPPKPTEADDLEIQDAAIDNQNSDSAAQKRKSPLKPAGIATIGVGAALLVGGIITGRLAISKSNKLEDRCGDDKDHCDPDNEHLKTEADKLEKVNLILFATGAAVTATGIMLAVIGHKKNKSNERINTAPVIGKNMMGLTLQARF